MKGSLPGSSCLCSRQEYWSELLYPPPGNLSDSGIEPMSLISNLSWQVDSLPVAPPGKPSKPMHTGFFWNRCRWPSLPLFFLQYLAFLDQTGISFTFNSFTDTLEFSWLTNQALKGRYQQVTLKISFHLAYSLWEFAVWLRRLKQGLCINMVGRGGEGDGTEVQKGGTLST